MTREIKFRAWDFEFHSMEYDMGIGNGKALIASEDLAKWQKYNETFERYYPKNVLMQYTGLRDNTPEEVEIYEGDILHARGSLYGVVVFQDGRFGIDTDEKFYTLKMWLNTYPSRVVSNIYEPRIDKN